MILTYHEIAADASSYLYGVTPARFRDHVSTLTAWHRAGMPIFTFDDGHISHYEHAAPMLEERLQRGIFFVTAGWTGVRPDYMSVHHLRDLIARGHSVQAHGWSHCMLTRCSPSQLIQELRRSKLALEDWLGVSVRALSVPHGRWNGRVREVCEFLGFTNLYISELAVPATQYSGVKVIGRFMVTRSLSAEDLVNATPTKGKGLRRSMTQALKIGLRAALGEHRYHALWTRVADPRSTVSSCGMSDEQSGIRAGASRELTVLHLISSGGFYGAESMIIALADTLRAAGCKIIIGVFHNAHSPHLEVAEYAAERGIPVEIIPCSGRIDACAARSVASSIYRHGVDLVHTHGFKANLYAKLARVAVPLIATYHLDWPDRGFTLYVYHALDRLVLRGFQKVIAVSKPIERSLRRSGLSRRKLATIANGIDLEHFRNSTPLTVSASGGMKVGLVGRLTPQKGHRYLIEAAPKILASCPNVTFLFIGDGPDRQQLETLVKGAGLQKRFAFSGAQRDMASVYAGLDAVVLPSINEGLPMTLIEALAAGRPVVATSVGDVPTLIRNRESGLLVEPRNPDALAQAVISVLTDTDLRTTLARNGQQWVEQNFSATAMADRYHEIYRETLQLA